MPLPNSSVQESYQRLLSPRNSTNRLQMQVVPYTVGTRFAPIVATTAVVVTLITCVSLAKTKDIYLGGLAWPYFSDTGRDAPAYSIFCVGLTVVAAALIVTWIANYQFQCELIEKKESHESSDNAYGKSIRKYCGIVRVLGVISAVGLPVLAFFSTTSYPDVHKYAAYWFFVLEAFALVINTIASFKLTRLTDAGNSYYASESEAPPAKANELNPWSVSQSSTRRTFYIQLVFTTLFWIGFVLYIPVGLALIDDFQRLSIHDVHLRTL
ncbi:hypothetical protein V7S43_014781 [Phytophthora oleae]|uniref:CWH43-like N-terminal domain-containing protein n=1 Tax=Phytophthora oleae TaxID=2107226 RepID=A0ABD3F3L6_9STRA